MTAPLTLRRRQTGNPRPAEMAYDSRLIVRQQLLAGDADARQQQIQRSRESSAHGESRGDQV
jgi:hypothetical protein